MSAGRTRRGKAQRKRRESENMTGDCVSVEVKLWEGKIQRGIRSIAASLRNQKEDREVVRPD